nr:MULTISPECIES: alkaline phosphatase family protein [Frankia]
MFRSPTRRAVGMAASGLALSGLVAFSAATPAVAGSPEHTRSPVRHVLLLSVDGLHQADLSAYVRTHPGSALAGLVGAGVSYTHASTPVPSDSFPGLIAQVTGGNPATTGIYYDDTFNHSLLPAGTTSCAGAKPGAEVAFTEAADRDPSSLDAGQGLAGLPGSILSMTGSPRTLLDPKTLPVDPKTCTPVYPHSYLTANTVFEVARTHGLGTAWSDKHPAYEILNGPSGTGVQDLFTPEINSTALGYPGGGDWTKDNAATRQYDAYKVTAVRNEIDGYDHGRTRRVPTPAIFGLNLQSVSTAQKLPTSDGLTGGYLPGGTEPGPLLAGALDFVDHQVGALVAELTRTGQADSTVIILSAKHAQSPTDPNALTRIDDGAVIKALNADWAKAHPGAADLVAFSTDDDILQLWLSDRSQAAADFARTFVLSHDATGNTISGASRTLPASGLTTAYAGAGAARFFGVPASDARHPDVVGIVAHGVVYTGGTSKIAEHGGADPQDRNVPLVVSGAGAGAHAGRVDGAPVETTSIAPTILTLLGLDPNELSAVRNEHTRALDVTPITR